MDVIRAVQLLHFGVASLREAGLTAPAILPVRDRAAVVRRLPASPTGGQLGGGGRSGCRMNVQRVTEAQTIE